MQTKSEKASTGSSAIYETENDLPRNTRAEVIGIINQRLADIIDLQTQLKQAHWNVKGPHFIGLHELFDKIAEEVESYVDVIAELLAFVRASKRGITSYGGYGHAA